MHRTASSVILSVSTLLVVGCAEKGSPEDAGRRLAVAVAPLSLPGIGFACYDLSVTTGASQAQTVWSLGDPAWTLTGADQSGGPGVGTPDGTTVCSDDFGNAAGGDITYIGTCDATLDSDGVEGNGVQNRVTLWVDGLYSNDGQPLGEWQDPCPNGCALDVDCTENADSLARFDLTIMRQANQGFFDVAVNFDDIFCSAKLDSCYPDGPDADALPEPMRLLFGADLAREWTAVFAMACTGGPGADGQTALLYGPVAVTCTGPDAVFTIDPTLAPGNQSVTVGDVTLGYAIYRGVEALDCGAAGDCNKLYWNLALNLEDLAGFDSCALALEATAHGGTGFANGVPTARGLSYPYIQVASALVDSGGPRCQRNPLNGTDPLNGESPSQVVTGYAGSVAGLPAPTPMCAEFDGDVVTSTGGCAPASLVVTHVLSGTIDSSSVAGIIAGDTFTATLSYDAAQTPLEGGWSGQEDYASYDLVLTVNGQTFVEDPSSTLAVMNDQGFDALLSNGTNDGYAGFSIVWSQDTLSSTALPMTLSLAGVLERRITLGGGGLLGTITQITSAP